MKKLLILGLVLALVAILAVPVTTYAAGNTATATVSGSVVGPKISISVPNNLPLGTFTSGWNVKDWTNNGQSPSNLGSIALVQGTDGNTAWSVTAQGSAYMKNSGISLTDPLFIGPSNGTWSCADGTSSGSVHGSSYGSIFTVTGSNTTGSFNFWAAQYIESSDGQNVANAHLTSATFNDTITFTATCTP